jgi:hypothetical protein
MNPVNRIGATVLLTGQTFGVFLGGHISLKNRSYRPLLIVREGMPVQKYVPSYLTKFSPIWFVWQDRPYSIRNENLSKIREYSWLSQESAVNSVRADII